MERNVLESVVCNLCGCDDTKIIYKERYDLEKVSDMIEKFKSSGDEPLIDRVVECKKCGLRYVNPRINIKSVISAYSEGSDENFVSQSEGRERTFEKQLKVISKYVKLGKVLDIGTAGGSFLAVAKKKGWIVEGIEPNKWLCDWSFKQHNIKVHQGVLEDHKFSSNEFDLITLWDVIEHTGDPKKVLIECNRILKKDGIIVINVPDISSIWHNVMGRKWFFYLSVHLYYFSRKTMQKMLRSANFEPILFKNHFQTLELGYLCFRLHAYNKVLSRLMTYIVKKLGLSKLPINYWIGQTLVIAKKVNSK